ncbi:MAG: hypothetical protein GW823_04915 [Bacteroidetes bacterium]|nr:hypothetical protein [Bacteroidota bacterium]
MNYRYLKFKKNEKKEVQLGFSIDLKSQNNKFGSIDTLSIVFEVDNRMGDIERIQN